MVADPFHVIQEELRTLDEARRIEQEVRRRKISTMSPAQKPGRPHPKAGTGLGGYLPAIPHARPISASPTPRPSWTASFCPFSTPTMLRWSWGRTLRVWKAEPLSYHRHRVTSAYTEGTTPRSSSSSASATGSATATCMCERCSWPLFPWSCCSARHTY